MDLKEPELRDALQQFDSLIIEYPDDRHAIPEFTSFITKLVKTKTNTVTLPIEDVMAIMKEKKPLVFSILRSEYSNNIMINVVTHIDKEYGEAYRKLNDLKRKLGIILKY
ncbi:hypothetical protein [Halalkalibacter alkalisediminis]|uniref:Uncharacterized protein n=1 Tax=Halalkalibacter alkalisediminis TaxID=935616 RepID=A0ABV6NEC2_9BACI|nr:hypothetical protein [Halalkalibacter alkalisediminis]